MTARIIVDGYNVIGTAHGDMEKARRQLVDLLTRYREASHHDVTVVFDGYHQGGGTETFGVTGGVQVIYSRLRERADDVIKRIVSKDGTERVVVTSDREIAGHAWSRGSVPVSSETFLALVERRLKDTRAGSGPGTFREASGDQADNPDLEEEKAMSRKGNPRRLSRRQRALTRVLNRL
jgi:predicted RNA-binding protein with PIN domain